MRTRGELVEFLGDDPAANAPDYAPAWLILVVDDDPDVHRSSELALRGTRILERPLDFLHAYTAAEALGLLADHPHVAVILLDVVMETDDAGLGLVRTVRQELGMAEVRIILRTGQPGYAPEIETICNYDINDYKTKNELTRVKLLTAVIAAVRSFDQLCRLEASRRGLKKIVSACNDLISVQGLHAFCEGVLVQLAALVGIQPSGLVCARHDGDDVRLGAEVVAAAGRCVIYQDLLFDDIDDLVVAGSLRRAFDTGARQLGPRHMSLSFRGRQGQAFAVYLESETALRPVDDQLLDVFCSNIAICCENVELLAELREHAFTDRLLRLPNRVTFIERIEAMHHRQALAGKAVALIDIDEFAEANDMFGHAYGDRLLQAIAARLVDALGDRCVVARVAGDVFGVLGDETLVRPQVLMPLFEAPFAPAGTEHRVSASMGLVRLTGYGGTGADLLKDASIAIKRGKAGGQGQAMYFTEAIAQESRQRTRLLADLRHAFQARELYMAFQPQIDLATHRIVGVEALMRWPTADTMISPEIFIPVAEQSGLIVDLGEWALHQALRLLESLRNEGWPLLRVAVNVSLVQFRHPGFLAAVDRALREHEAPAQALELEITESVAMMGSSAIERSLHELKSRQIAVAIDDFGTGYSSLSYLDRLPVDRLKIDKAFIRPLASPQPDTRLVEMVIALSHKLGLQVVAEGVETEAQAALLRQFGCDEAQGYLWGKPMTADELRRVLAADQARNGPNPTEVPP
ncbi:MAG TPA: EAL domain-containing protein [Ideonella sp.]|uniref:GGDEF/EAL domain-containing response regulator n=1 Tax=Ideonella sp. TaxID=1929293 RepID=UPI002E327ED9|nr:EAL domain-containing protein [Ideonella sp.]HEX5685620.1 EAL domain-containing protein [Ideonella sp.]